MANTIVWFDLPVANLERATTFYSKLLAKKLEVIEEHGCRMTVFPHQDEDVAGCLCQVEKFVPNKSDLLIYFDVNKRIHQAVAEVKANGGEVIEDVQAIGPYGFRAVITDTEGNKVALHAMVSD